VVLASLSDEALSVYPTRPQPADGRTENLPTRPDVLVSTAAFAFRASGTR